MVISLIHRAMSGQWFAALTISIFAAFAALASNASAEERRIDLYNIHTKDSISIVYKRDGQYIPEALTKLNYFMRDWRRNITIKMDPELIDLLWDIHHELGSKKPIHLICGHRSESTNEMLRRTRGGQAKASKHITGQAADVEFPDIPVKQLRNSALIRERGGVGYYPTSAIPFVHVDTGRVRSWPRLPRQELALLFPSGHSKHVPIDGKPITKKDFQIAMANLHEKGGELPVALQRHLHATEAEPTVLASLSSDDSEPVPVPAKEPKPHFALASLTPFAGRGEAPLAPKPEAQQAAIPAVQSRTIQTAARAGEADIFRRDFRDEAPSDTVPEDQMAAAPDYDDDHPDELNYQPFPVLPLMSNTPVASMDMTGGDAETLSLPKVHLMFAESRDMLHMQFEPGLQYAQLYWAQRFQGAAVNTELKRVVREDPTPAPATAVKTARK